MFKSTAEKELFINHLKYLVNLSDSARLRRTDWKEMQRVLASQGYKIHRYRAAKWRLRHLINNLKSKQQ